MENQKLNTNYSGGLTTLILLTLLSGFTVLLTLKGVYHLALYTFIFSTLNIQTLVQNILRTENGNNIQSGQGAIEERNDLLLLSFIVAGLSSTIYMFVIESVSLLGSVLLMVGVGIIYSLLRVILRSNRVFDKRTM